MIARMPQALGFLLIAATAAGAQARWVSNSKADEVAIQRIVEEAIAAHHTGDAERWLKLADEDVSLMLEGAPAISGYANVAKFAREWFGAHISTLTADIMEIRVDGNLAIVRTSDRGTFTPKAGGPSIAADMKEILVLRRSANAGWKVTHVIANNNRPSSPPFTDVEARAIRGVVADWVKSGLAADADANSRRFTADGVILPPNGAPVVGREAIRRYLADYPKITSFTTTIDEVTGEGNIAFARGRYDITVQLPDGTSLNDKGSFLEVHQRQADGSWPYTRLMWHSDIPVPALRK